MNIQAQLLLMILLALVPTLAAHGFNDVLQYRERVAAVREAAIATAELRNSELDGMTTGMERLLESAVRIPVSIRDPAACHVELASLKENIASDVVLLIADPLGRVLCSSIGGSQRFDIEEQAFFRSVLEARRFSIAGYVETAWLESSSLAFALPLADGKGKVERVALAFLSLQSIESGLAKARLLAGQSFTVADQNGIVLAHLSDGETPWAARRLSAEYLAPMRAAKSGTFDMDDLEGRPAIFGYIPITMPPQNLYVLFAIDKKSALAPIISAAWRDLASTLLSFLLAAGLASVIAVKRIRDPIRRLLDISRQWRDGQYSARAPSAACAELQQLSGHLNSMADAIQIRDRQLSAANRAKELVLATAGHDLRQPLQIVASALSLLRGKHVDASEVRYLRAAQSGVAELTAGLDTLVEATRSHGDLLEMAREPLAVRDVLDQAVAHWAEKAIQKNLGMRCHSCDAVVVSNGKMLATILHNLIGNALKYTEAGGVLICCRQRTHEAWIEVYDTGPGIPEDKLDSVFQQFRRLSSTKEGFGLGLWITRNTAEALGHVLTVRSVRGKGSRFRLVLPLAREAAPVADAGRAHSLPDRGNAAAVKRGVDAAPRLQASVG